MIPMRPEDGRGETCFAGGDFAGNMSPAVKCPQCGHLLPTDARSCPNCGVDLALLSLLAERAYLEGFPESAPLPEGPGAVVPRLGEYLLEQQLITSDQLESALARQRTLSERGEPHLLGQTLLAMGYVDKETLDRAITRQIIELHAALQEANRTLERRVTERTAELRRALERLTEINQIKANLISNVSHELRTPLAHIKGYIELMAEGQLGELSEGQSKALNVVERATERLGRLIEDLIEYSTASRGGMTLKTQPIKLNQLISSVLDRSREKAAKAGVQLLNDVEEGLPVIQADAEKLSWVIFQLVDNGIKFTPGGGKVSVRAGQDDRLLTVTVQDSGIGIPPDRIQEIFEPFHQLDSTPTRRYGGTGLGLALVKLILDAHGAEMRIESQEGRGSAFSFTLPLPESAS
jgi:signal transduction histidine kinase